MRENNVVAIDFGTSRTKLAYFDPKTEELELMNHGVEKYLPSYFAVDKDEEILLGYDAQKMFASEDFDHRRIVSNIKGQISEVSINFVSFPRRVQKTPQDLLTALFRHLKKEAGKLPAFETEPQRVYLTHPTTFSDDDQEILENSAQAAGFSVELIEEPEAAAQFVAMSGTDLPTDIIILDCGAGTLHWAYMALEYGYGKKPKYIIKEGESGELEPGGTISGIPDGKDETKRLIGGRNVELALGRELRRRVGRITDDDFEFLRHELRVRKEQFCRNPNGKLHPIKIRDFSVPVSAREMKAAIEANYIIPACNEVEPYIKNVIDVTGKAGRKPALVLTGGCAQIEDFAVALNNKFKLDCIVIRDFEYATVLGAVPLSEAVRSKLSEHMQTQQSESIETAESKEAVTAIKETFDTFGKKIGATIANDVMSCLMGLLPEENHKWNLDIGGDDSCYVPKLGSGKAGWDHETVRQNIIPYFVENLPDSIFWKVDEITEFFQEEFPNFFTELEGEVLQVHHTCQEDVKEVVRHLLGAILIQIDIRKQIRSAVKETRMWRGIGAPITVVVELGSAITAALDKKRTRKERKAEFRRRHARFYIHGELQKFLEPQRRFFVSSHSYATPLRLHPETSENAFEMVERWLAEKVFNQLSDNWEDSGKTPLHTAASENAFKMVEALLAHGANPNAKDNSGKTPLHTAVSENASEAVEVLLAHGADPNAEDNSGETPLHTAASWRYWYRLDAIEVLLAHDADPNDHGEFDITSF